MFTPNTVISNGQKPVIYRGQKILRNKHGVKINRARWELSSANLEPSSDRQHCETSQQEDEKRDESVIRCTSDDTSKYITTPDDRSKILSHFQTFQHSGYQYYI